MKATMRVLHIKGGDEAIYVCHKAELSRHDGEDFFVWIHMAEHEVLQVSAGEVLILGDDGKCVHRWDLDLKNELYNTAA